MKTNVDVRNKKPKKKVKKNVINCKLNKRTKGLKN